MELEIRELTETFAKLVVSGVTPGFMNSLRRVLIADVPKMAIEDVEFHLGSIRDESGKEYESVSPLFDEVVAHRLGLVPIPTDLELFNFRDECTCEGEGCPSCMIMYRLNKKGPCTVYSGDLEPLGDSSFAIKDKLIPIVKLDKGQAILVYATAILGRGSEHAKWQPTCGIGYKYYPKIEINHDLCTFDVRACVDICPKNVLQIKNKKLVVGDNLEDCTLCKACEEVSGTRNKGDKGRRAIKVTGDETKIIFKFETDGALSAADAFRCALILLESKVDEFRKGVSKLV